MLLVDAPFTRDAWTTMKLGCPKFQRMFLEYCDEYALSVLALPEGQMAKIIAHLVRGLECCQTSREAFHVIVERELAEQEFEPSNKLIRLVVLCALANSLNKRVFDLPEQTTELLGLCEQLIPEVAVLAVNDHFGVLHLTTDEDQP